MPEKKKSDCQKWKVNEKHVKGAHAFGAASQSGLMAKVKKAKTRVSVAPRPKAASKKVTAADSEPKVTAAASSSRKVEVKKENEASSSGSRSKKLVEVKKEKIARPWAHNKHVVTIIKDEKTETAENNLITDTAVP